MKFSTPFLLHSSVLVILVLPGILIRLNRYKDSSDDSLKPPSNVLHCRNPSLAPVIAFISEFLSSIVELMVYRGLNAPPRDHSKYLEEFEPEHNEENASLLNKALGWGEKEDKKGLSKNAIDIWSNEIFRRGLVPAGEHQPAESRGGGE